MTTISLQTEFPDRLVTLSDGRPGLRGGIHVTTREPAAADASPSPDGQSGADGEGRGEGGTAVLDFISSDATLDRYQEIIVPTGWQLANYQRNPVFQNSHQYGDIMFTLGKALVTEVRAGSLFQRILFATEANPLARIAYGLYKGKFLNAVSVGFIPIRWENGTAESGFRRKYLEQELLEVSAVGIPANPNALALAYKSGAVQKSDLHETIELLRQLTATNAPGTGPIPPITPTVFRLARSLRDLLVL